MTGAEKILRFTHIYIGHTDTDHSFDLDNGIRAFNNRMVRRITPLDTANSESTDEVGQSHIHYRWILEIEGDCLEAFFSTDVSAEVSGAVADDGGVTTDETTETKNSTVNDMTLLPTVPAVNDAYYFGNDKTFDGVTVNIGISGAGTWTITWEYYNGSAWASLSGVTDGTTHFRAVAGSHNVTWTIPTDWQKTTVATIKVYWVRARVSAYTSITTQPKGTQAFIISSTGNEYAFYPDGDANRIGYFRVLARIRAGDGTEKDRIWTITGGFVETREEMGIPPDMITVYRGYAQKITPLDA